MTRKRTESVYRTVCYLTTHTSGCLTRSVYSCYSRSLEEISPGILAWQVQSLCSNNKGRTMKISVKKKMGYVHVRATRVLRVAKEHAVSTCGLSELTDRKVDDAWVYCEVGDLVIEVAYAKTGKILGYSYLSGPAIQMMNYTPPRPWWFEETPVVVKNIADGVRDDMFDVGVFRTKAAGVEEAYKSLNNIEEWYEQEDSGKKGHVLGIIEVGKGRALSFHAQPPKHANDYDATTFQISLLWEMVKNS